MPNEFYVILGLCVAVMGVSAWFTGEKDRRRRNFARVGLVLGGAGLFVSTMLYTSILIAALIVALPLALIAAWWSGITDWFSGLWE